MVVFLLSPPHPPSFCDRRQIHFSTVALGVASPSCQQLTSDGGVIVSEKSERGIGKRGRRRKRKKKRTQDVRHRHLRRHFAPLHSLQSQTVKIHHYLPSHVWIIAPISHCLLPASPFPFGSVNMGEVARHGTGLFFLFFHCYHDYLFIYLLQRKEITAWIKSVAACPVHSHHCLAGERRMTIPLLW